MCLKTKRDKKIALISSAILSVIVGGALYLKFMPKVSLSKYTKTCLYFAVLDDEICRNELEGNFIRDNEIKFPARPESVHYRYKMFLDIYKGYSKKELNKEMQTFEKRLQESKQYLNKPKQKMTLK